MHSLQRLLPQRKRMVEDAALQCKPARKTASTRTHDFLNQLVTNAIGASESARRDDECKL